MVSKSYQSANLSTDISLNYIFEIHTNLFVIKYRMYSDIIKYITWDNFSSIFKSNHKGKTLLCTQHEFYIIFPNIFASYYKMWIHSRRHTYIHPWQSHVVQLLHTCVLWNYVHYISIWCMCIETITSIQNEDTLYFASYYGLTHLNSQ